MDFGRPDNGMARDRWREHGGHPLGVGPKEAAREVWKKALDFGDDQGPDAQNQPPVTASGTWHMASRRLVWLGMLGALLLATGCRNVRHTTSAALPERSANELLDSLKFREPTWQTLGLRMESSAHAMDKEGSFTMNVRMAKDSVMDEHFSGQAWKLHACC